MMDAMFFAKILGPTLLLFGLFSIFFREEIAKISKNFEGAYGAYWLEAITSMIFGLAILNGFNSSKGVAGLVALFGWILFVKGVLLLFFSKPSQAGIWNNKVNLILLGAIRLAFGLIFTYSGYYC